MPINYYFFNDKKERILAKQDYLAYQSLPLAVSQSIKKYLINIQLCQRYTDVVFSLAANKLSNQVKIKICCAYI